jgi:predicted ferric reductase
MSPGPYSPVETGSPVPLKEDHAGSTPGGVVSPAQLRTVRWATAAWCAALVAIVVIVHSRQEAKQVGAAESLWVFLHREVATLGLAAVALALLTLPFGLFYGRGFAARMRIAPQARAAHMAISLSALASIVLHIVALWSGYRLTWRNANDLLVPFAHSGDSRFPYPTAAGVLGFWLITLFGLSYFLRKRLGGAARWRVAHHLVIAGLALSVLHSVYLHGLIPGWGN